MDSVPRTLLRSRYDNFAMTLSPDGRWLAYVSDESGKTEVYVRPFPSVDSAKFAISVGGGLEPLWRRDGAELFFRNNRGDMYAVTVGTGRQFDHGAPRLLFSRPGDGIAGVLPQLRRASGWQAVPDAQLRRRRGEESERDLQLAA